MTSRQEVPKCFRQKVLKLLKRTIWRILDSTSICYDFIFRPYFIRKEKNNIFLKIQNPIKDVTYTNVNLWENHASINFGAKKKKKLFLCELYTWYKVLHTLYLISFLVSRYIRIIITTMIICIRSAGWRLMTHARVNPPRGT